MANKLTKLVLIFFFTALHFASTAQSVYVPDSAFRAYLTGKGYCITGDSLDVSCPAVANETFLEIFCTGIYNLEGVQYFPNLDTLKIHGHDTLQINAFPQSVKLLDLSNSNMDIPLPIWPSGLVDLRINSNKFYSIPNFPSTLEYLNCNINNLTSLPVLPNGLLELRCGNNPLHTLAPLPSGLTYLSCGADSLTSLPSLPSTLTFLECGTNQITSIPSLPSTLRNFDCRSNFLTSIPLLPASLITLNCDFNQLANLPTLNANLRTLSCQGNLLTSLPALPSLMYSLDCTLNQITALPNLPPTLDRLSASSNQLTQLPTLPGALEVLYCSLNPNLTALPTLPFGMVILDVHSCDVLSLPSIPSTVNYLNCADNQIVTLPSLPDSMLFLIVNDNPISCLPPISKVEHLYIQNTFITCFPNVINYITLSADSTYYPICQPNNNCPLDWSIYGEVFNDGNTDCAQNNNEPMLKYVPLVLDSAGVEIQRTWTNRIGQYDFLVDSGTFEVSVDTTDLPFDVNCPVSGIYSSTINAANSLDSLGDFALSCRAGFDLVSRSIIVKTPFRLSRYSIVDFIAGDAAAFYNAHCYSGPGTVRVVYSGPIAYTSTPGSALTPSSISGDTLIWNIADFSTIDPMEAFSSVFQTSVFANGGDPVCFDLTISAPTIDNNSSNDHFSICDQVLNGYDPNDKTGYPSGLVDTTQQWFTYLIRFQNTGNDTAFGIVVLDTLDQNFDASSVQILAASHEVNTSLLNGNLLRFEFNGIYLPDSTTDEVGSHGYVQYKIKRKAGLPVGTEFNNTAYIYFDLNPPIATNTTSATLSSSVNVKPVNESIQYSIYPNPTSNSFTVSSATNLTSIEVTDLLGNVLVFQKASGVNQLLINMSGVEAGVYFVKVISGTMTAVTRIIKL